MKGLKILGNVIVNFISVVLSVALTVILLTVPVLLAASSFLKADTVQEIAAQIDYSELLSEGELGDTLLEQGIDSEMIGELMETDTVKEVIDLYIDDMFSVMDGSGSAEEAKLTPEALQEIANENMDELVALAKKYIKVDEVLSDEAAREIITQVVEEQAENVVEMLPLSGQLLGQPEEPASGEAVPGDTTQGEATQGTQNQQTGSSQEGTGLLDENLLQIITSVRSGRMLLIVGAVATILSLLIVLLRFRHFKGFMWLGVVFLLAAAISLLIALLVRSSGITLLTGLLADVEWIVGPAMSVLSAELLKGAGVLAGSAGVLIVIFVVGRKVKAKNVTY